MSNAGGAAAVGRFCSGTLLEGGQNGADTEFEAASGDQDEAEMMSVGL